MYDSVRAVLQVEGVIALGDGIGHDGNLIGGIGVYFVRLLCSGFFGRCSGFLCGGLATTYATHQCHGQNQNKSECLLHSFSLFLLFFISNIDSKIGIVI